MQLKVLGMSKLILEGHIVVSDTDLAKVMAELPAHIELTRNEEGCLSSRSPKARTPQMFFMSMKNSLIGLHLKRTSNALSRPIGVKPLRMSKGTIK